MIVSPFSQQATRVSADVILFCGVHFMCETAKILNPGKKVILPDINAGCSLTDSAPPDKFKDWVKVHIKIIRLLAILTVVLK